MDNPFTLGNMLARSFEQRGNTTMNSLSECEVLYSNHVIQQTKQSIARIARLGWYSATVHFPMYVEFLPLDYWHLSNEVKSNASATIKKHFEALGFQTVVSAYTRLVHEIKWIPIYAERWYAAVCLTLHLTRYSRRFRLRFYSPGGKGVKIARESFEAKRQECK